MFFDPLSEIHKFIYLGHFPLVQSTKQKKNHSLTNKNMKLLYLHLLRCVIIFPPKKAMELQCGVQFQALFSDIKQCGKSRNVESMRYLRDESFQLI